MSGTDYFDGFEGTNGSKFPLEGWMREVLIRANAFESDIAALERIPPDGETDREVRRTRGRAFRFILELRSDKGAKLGILEELALRAAARGYPAQFGGETLAGKARYDIKGFTIDNDLRPFYVLAILQRHTSLEPKLELSSPEASALAAAGWAVDPPADAGES